MPLIYFNYKLSVYESPSRKNTYYKTFGLCKEQFVYFTRAANYSFYSFANDNDGIGHQQYTAETCAIALQSYLLSTAL